MEDLPVEIVGEILSRVADARPVVLASATCRKWRRAFREHLRVLSFRSEDWRGLECHLRFFFFMRRRGRFTYLTASQVEILMTRTILRTTSLQSLIIDMRDVRLPVEAVMSWLRHTRKSLRVFHFVADRTYCPLNVVKICGWEKLEKLTMSNGVIHGVNPDCHLFTSLRSLSLRSCVCISETDFNALLSVCSNLESLELIEPECLRNLEKFNVVAPPNISRICIDSATLDELILKSDGVKHLHLRSVAFGLFKLIGKDTLKGITMDSAAVDDIDISDSVENLETINIIRSDIPHSELFRLISKSSKLRTLRLWCDVVNFDWVEPADLEIIAKSCPQLSHLSLGCHFGRRYHMRKEGELFFPYCLGGSTCFENVIYLKVGWWWDTFGDKFLDVFFDLVECLLERCPSLKELVFDGKPDLKYQEDGQVIARFNTRILRIMRKCTDSNVQFTC